MAQAWFCFKKTHNYVYLNLASVIKCLALQMFQLWGVFVFVGFFSFHEDLYFKLVMYSPTRQLGDPKPNVKYTKPLWTRIAKGLTNLCPQCFLVWFNGDTGLHANSVQLSGRACNYCWDQQKERLKHVSPFWSGQDWGLCNSFHTDYWGFFPS